MNLDLRQVIPEIHRDVTHPIEQFFEGVFDRLRAQLRDRYADWTPGQGSDKRRAVQTMVHNESVFFPIWLAYYSRFFAPEDIFVFDHETTDGSTARDGFVRIPVEHESVDHVWMMETLASHQRELLDRYEVVLTTDVDELVVPDPAWGSLSDYIDRFEDDLINCLGYELLHLTDREPPLRLGEPILSQRGYWFANDAYNKPALATAPTSWAPGFHSETGGLSLDPDLRMIHLHRMDYAICLARHREREAMKWNERDTADGWAAHNLITAEDEFARWFYTDRNLKGGEIVVEEIPPVWRGVF